MSVKTKVTVPPGRVLIGAYATPDEPAGAGDEPVPPPTRREPRRLAAMGGRGPLPGPCGRQAAARLHRLLRLPLVPCDGARVVRGRGDRGRDERALCQRQGRPRGAAG